MRKILKDIIALAGLSVVLIVLLLPQIRTLANPVKGQTVDLATAWAINKDGYFISANHLVTDNHTFQVRYHSVWYTAQLVARDSTIDIAVFKVAIPTPDFLPLEINPTTNEDVSIIGLPNAELFSDLSTTQGIYSTDLFTSGYFEVSNTIVCHGNSGGPVIGHTGVVGVLDLGYAPFDLNECAYHGGGPTSLSIMNFLNKYHINYSFTGNINTNDIVMIVGF
jgi:S1-C subfamily serine protease